MPQPTQDSYGKNYGRSQATKSFLGGGGLGAIGAGIGTAIGTPLGGVIGGAIGTGLDLIAGIFSKKSQRKAEEKAIGMQIDAQNLNQMNQWRSREAQRDKWVDDPVFKQGMNRGGSEFLSNVGYNPLRAEDRAIDIQNRIAEMS